MRPVLPHDSGVRPVDGSVQVEIQDKVAARLIKGFAHVPLQCAGVGPVHESILIGIAQQSADLHVVVAAQRITVRVGDPAESDPDNRLVDHAGQVESQGSSSERGVRWRW
ncbi:hypothetical protein BH20VER3_BH20VER3_03040 [soil metagenome]